MLDALFWWTGLIVWIVILFGAVSMIIIERMIDLEPVIFEATSMPPALLVDLGPGSGRRQAWLIILCRLIASSAWCASCTASAGT